MLSLNSSTRGSLPHHFERQAVEKLLTCALLSLNTVETNKTVKNYSILVLGCVEPLAPVLNLKDSAKNNSNKTQQKAKGRKLNAPQ